MAVIVLAISKVKIKVRVWVTPIFCATVATSAKVAQNGHQHILLPKLDQYVED